MRRRCPHGSGGVRIPGLPHDLDVQVARLRLLKSSHQSQKYQLEDRLLQYYPREIAAAKAAITGCEADVATRDAHPRPWTALPASSFKGSTTTSASPQAKCFEYPAHGAGRSPFTSAPSGASMWRSPLEAFGKHVLTLKGTLSTTSSWARMRGAT